MSEEYVWCAKGRPLPPPGGYGVEALPPGQVRLPEGGDRLRSLHERWLRPPTMEEFRRITRIMWRLDRAARGDR